MSSYENNSLHLERERERERESTSINVIKAVAVLSVLAAHTVSFSDTNMFLRIFSSIWICFGHVGVISFLVISGFLYKRSNGDGRVYWKKRFFGIILPWIVCATLTYVISALRSHEIGLVTYLKWIFGHGTWYYYVTIYLILILAFKLIMRHDWLLFTVIGIQIALLVLGTFNIPTTPPVAFLTDSLNPFHWAGYFALGVLIRKYELHRITKFRTLVLILATCISFGSLAILIFSQTFTYFNVITMIYGLSSFIVISSVAYAISSFGLSNLLARFGTYSYCIYLLHMQIVQPITSRLPITVGVIGAPIVAYVIMVALVSLGVFICNKLPFGSKLKMLVGLK